jgi:hypothetical protein
MTGATGYVAPESLTPFPSGDFFIVQITEQSAQATNSTTHAVNGTSFERTDLLLGEATAQIDFYGTGSQDNCNTALLLSRSDLLEQYGIMPLYGTTPKQLPFTNAGNVLVERWILEIKLQFNANALTIAPELTTVTITTEVI